MAENIWRNIDEDEHDAQHPVSKQSEFWVATTADGDLLLPPEIVKKMGIVGGAKLRLTVNKDRIEIFPNIHSLARLYLEPTSKCNLTCRTCIRNTWDEPAGEMEIAIFDKLVDELKQFKELQTVMFGGFGEPAAHPEILYMIGKVKSLGVKTEMVTNGTLLDETMLKGLLDNRLDTLWVSFDGTSTDNYENIRAGASYHDVIGNLKLLKKLSKNSPHQIKIGIAFVVMKKNIDDLPNINKLAKATGARMVSVSNVLPYSREMAEQMVCDSVLIENKFKSVPDTIAISLPKIDHNNITKEALHTLLKRNKNISIMTNPIGIETNRCRFIKERSAFVRWDGAISPCMGLLHSYKTYLDRGDIERQITSYTLGNIGAQSLKEIWDSPEYFEFRERVSKFDFSPCYACGGCEFVGKNDKDCFGNEFPTCGGCLWAQGVIQCP